VAAPFTPFISETIYRNLKGRGDPESVHLCDFPTANAVARDLALERDMAAVQTIVKLGRQLRVENDLKVRQPLSKILVAGVDTRLEDLILDELNIKSLECIVDETDLCDMSFKANFKTLGRKCGPKMKAVAAAIAAMKSFSGSANVEGFDLTAEDVLVTRTPKAGMVVASEGAVVVGLETALTPELVAEGLAREFVSHVQSMRKEADFEVTQRIAVTAEVDDETRAALQSHADYVKTEILAVSLDFAQCGGTGVDLNGHAAKIAVAKA
jgi:isoleucyl-tRNA synthetase